MESHQTSVVYAEEHPGRRFFIRPLFRGDRRGLSVLFARLSAESRRLRYLSPKPELSERELTFLSNIDHIRHEALGAIDAVDGSIIGVARYVRWDDRPGAADVAIEVADDLHRSGIGLMLAEALVRRAHEDGLAVLTATALWENRPARALAQRVGFMARGRPGTEIELELDLCRGAAGPELS